MEKFHMYQTLINETKQNNIMRNEIEETNKFHEKRQGTCNSCNKSYICRTKINHTLLKQHKNDSINNEDRSKSGQHAYIDEAQN